MLDLRRLRLLRELGRRGTITAVAKALSYSPSAVSQQLTALEKETGVRLLEPAGRRVRLTAQADLLIAHTEVLLEEMESKPTRQSLKRPHAALAAFQTQSSPSSRTTRPSSNPDCGSRSRTEPEIACQPWSPASSTSSSAGVPRTPTTPPTRDERTTCSPTTSSPPPMEGPTWCFMEPVTAHGRSMPTSQCLQPADPPPTVEARSRFATRL